MEIILGYALAAMFIYVLILIYGLIDWLKFRRKYKNKFKEVNEQLRKYNLNEIE